MRRVVLTKVSSQKKVLISYANEEYMKSQSLLSKTARNKGFTELIEYGSQDVDDKFRTDHADVFSVKRGDGLWL